MKFKLARVVVHEELNSFICKELGRRRKKILAPPKRALQEMVAICEAIQKEGLPTNLVLKKLPDELGYGIFLHPDAKPLRKGQVVAPYSGKFSLEPQNDPGESDYVFAPLAGIRLSKADHAILDHVRPWHPRRLYELLVDADKEGNFTRFINHSEKPNVIAEEFSIPANSYGLVPSPIEIVYMVYKTIHPGEQLLVCYEGEIGSYWGAVGVEPLPITPRTFRLDGSLHLLRDEKH